MGCSPPFPESHPDCGASARRDGFLFLDEMEPQTQNQKKTRVPTEADTRDSVF